MWPADQQVGENQLEKGVAIISGCFHHLLACSVEKGKEAAQQLALPCRHCMQHHSMLALEAGMLLCLVVLQPSCWVNAAFVESFEPNPLKNTSNYLPGVWTQLGRFVEDGKAMVGEPKGWSLFLDAPNPWAETTMLQWDGSNPAQLVFEVIRYDMPDVGCVLKVLNTTDGEEWTEFFSQEIRSFPYKAWKTVRLTMPLSKMTGSKFGLRFHYVHACCCAGACCPGITINNLMLPAKAPTAATAVLKTRLASADVGAVAATNNSLGSDAATNSAKDSPTSSLRGKASTQVESPQPQAGDAAAAAANTVRPDHADGTPGVPANTLSNPLAGDSAASELNSSELNSDHISTNRAVGNTDNAALEVHGNTHASADSDFESNPPADAPNNAGPTASKAGKAARPVHGSKSATQTQNVSANRQPEADALAPSDNTSADSAELNSVNTAMLEDAAPVSQLAADNQPGSSDAADSAASGAEAHNSHDVLAGETRPCPWRHSPACGSLLQHALHTQLPQRLH